MPSTAQARVETGDGNTFFARTGGDGMEILREWVGIEVKLDRDGWGRI